MPQKTWHDVRGWQINCPNYIMCPLCYGCRNYDSSYLKCEKCADDMHNNVCTSKLHTEKNIAKMIKRPYIDLDKGVNNESN